MADLDKAIVEKVAAALHEACRCGDPARCRPQSVDMVTTVLTVVDKIGYVVVPKPEALS